MISPVGTSATNVRVLSAARARRRLVCRTKSWSAVALIASGLVVGGCGGHAPSGSGRSTASSVAVPEPVNSCAGSAGQWRSLGNAPVSAATLGTGPAIVFANDSGNSVCDWLPLAQRLASSGHRVAVFSYADASASAEAQAVRDTLAVAVAVAGPGRPFALVGASLGGRIVIEAAAKHPAGLAVIVSLSGEVQVEDYRSILADARRVRTPALYVGARDDGLTDGVRQQLALHNAMHGRPNELLQRPGTAHGTQLINGAPADAKDTVARLTAFLAQQLG
jgi:pimeloyl-ACP methyl ester carboxylesterase